MTANLDTGAGPPVSKIDDTTMAAPFIQDGTGFNKLDTLKLILMEVRVEAQ